MKYSFVIIAFNEEENIAACVNSILNLQDLGSSYEVIVIDDGSTDTTLDIIRSISKEHPSIKLINDGLNHGRGYGRWVGTTSATGSYIAMVDADILLPSNWLAICLKNIVGCAAVGGIAVPDGDVTYVYNRFHLVPKVARHSTTVSGGNGLFRNEVFKTVSFDKSLREGEDVDFNHKLVEHGYITKSISTLIVEHNENKNFYESLRWLYQSGLGASRQLRHYKKLRLPDITFLGFIFCIFFALSLYHLYKFNALLIFALPFAYSHLVSLVHLSTKFNLFNKLIPGLLSIGINGLFIFAYFFGRSVGCVSRNNK